MEENLLQLGLKDIIPLGVFFQCYNKNDCDGYCIHFRRVIKSSPLLIVLLSYFRASVYYLTLEVITFYAIWKLFVVNMADFKVKLLYEQSGILFPSRV